MNKTTLRFIPAITLIALILMLSWYGRLVQRAVRELLDLEGLLIFVCIACLVFVFVGMNIFRLRKGYVRWLLVVYPLGIYFLSGNPEEAVHLMEYGAFALSLSWILSGSISEKKSFVYSIIGASILGFIDEGLQGLNPERVFDLRDILINVIGAAVTVALFHPKEAN